MSKVFNPFGRIFVLAGLLFLYSFGYGIGFIEGSDLLWVSYRIGLPLYVAWWVKQDSQDTHYWPAYHYSLWLFSVWPIAVPHYVLKTRGIRGVMLATALLAALFSQILGWASGVGVGLLSGVYSLD